MEPENTALQPTPPVTTDPLASLRALLPDDSSERKRAFSALLRAVIDDRVQGS